MSLIAAFDSFIGQRARGLSGSALAAKLRLTTAAS
jgi:hypothetical protein